MAVFFWERDSQVLVQGLVKDAQPWRIDKQIAEIKSNVQFRMFKISHIFRQANSVVDALSKLQAQHVLLFKLQGFQ